MHSRRGEPLSAQRRLTQGALAEVSSRDIVCHVSAAHDPNLYPQGIGDHVSEELNPVLADIHAFYERDGDTVALQLALQRGADFLDKLREFIRSYVSMRRHAA